MFESGAILFFLAERFNDLLPGGVSGSPAMSDDEILKKRYETMKWFHFGSDTFSGEAKQLGFYYKYCMKNGETYPLVSRVE